MPYFTLLAATLLACWPVTALSELPLGWQAVSTLPAPEARQAAAADRAFVYVINNKVIARYDRQTGQRTAESSGEAHHLNSGFLHDGQLFCAHSNYPAKPEKSEIKVLDLQSMKLSDFKVFAEPPGSLTVAIKKNGDWWCIFAHYKKENGKTRLIRYNENWEETGSWSFPASVLSDLGNNSISGAIWQGNTLLATGHDKQVIYRLQLPAEGTELTHFDTVTAPFPGQGIAADPLTGGLVGIDRANRQVIFAEQVIPPLPGE